MGIKEMNSRHLWAVVHVSFFTPLTDEPVVIARIRTLS